MEHSEGDRHYKRRRRISRRRFLKLGALAAGAGAIAAGAVKLLPDLIRKIPEDDKSHSDWLRKTHQEWEQNERFQEGQIIEEPVVYNIEPVNVRSKPEAGYQTEGIIGQVEPGTSLSPGEIVKGGYVSEPGGRDQSNRWLKFKFTDEKGKERTAYISAVYIVPKEEYEEKGSKTEKP